VDLHLARSLIVREDQAGTELGVERIDNSPMNLATALADAGPNPEVAIEATYGWYWAVDALEELGATVHLVNPSGLGQSWEGRRVKNDYKDCRELIDRMRLHKLPEAWIAPPELRELRELVRYRAKLVNIRTGLKAQVKAVLAKHCLQPPVNELWGVAGPAWLDSLQLPDAYLIRIESLRDLVGVVDREVTMLERTIHRRLSDDAGYRAVQALDGVGRVLAAGCSSQRSATPDASRVPTPCARGPASHLAIVSPTARPTGARPPSRAHAWCAGRPSKPSPRCGAGPSSRSTTTALPIDEANTSLGWRWPASSSPSSTTACATARSAASPGPGRREAGSSQQRRELE
jgi:transposase